MARITLFSNSQVYKTIAGNIDFCWKTSTAFHRYTFTRSIILYFLFKSLKYLPAPRRGYLLVPLLCYYHHCRRTVADIFVAAVISIPQSYYKFIFMKIPESWNKKIFILQYCSSHTHNSIVSLFFFLLPVIWNSTRNNFWFLSSFLHLLCIYISRNLIVAFLYRYDTLRGVSAL